MALNFALILVAYVVITLLVQAVSHFGVNSAHYASIPFLRAEPIAVLGILASLVQGAVLAFLFPRLRLGGALATRAFGFAWLAGAFLVSYIAFVEAGKYSAPSVGAWVGVELGAGFVQFTLFGAALWLIARFRKVA